MFLFCHEYSCFNKKNDRTSRKNSVQTDWILAVNYFRKKSSIVDVRLASKYASDKVISTDLEQGYVWRKPGFDKPGVLCIDIARVCNLTTEERFFLM